MDPHELRKFRAICAHLSAVTEIRDVRHELIRAELLGEVPVDHQIAVAVAPTIENTKLSGGNFTVRANYVIELTVAESPSGDEEAKVSPVARIEVTVAGLFQAKPTPIDPADKKPYEPSEEEVHAYARSMGLFALHPYARSTAAQSSQLLGLPPFTLPALKIATGEMAD